MCSLLSITREERPRRELACNFHQFSIDWSFLPVQQQQPQRGRPPQSPGRTLLSARADPWDQTSNVWLCLKSLTHLGWIGLFLNTSYIWLCFCLFKLVYSVQIVAQVFKIRNSWSSEQKQLFKWEKSKTLKQGQSTGTETGPLVLFYPWTPVEKVKMSIYF